MGKFTCIKPVSTILLIGGGLIAYSLYRKNAAAGSLVFYQKGIKSLTWDNGPVITLNLGVGNTSNQSFTIFAIAGDLYTNDTYLGYVSNFTGININPRSEQTIPIKIKLDPIGVVSTIFNGIQNGTWKQDLQILLQANIDQLQVKVPTIKYKIGA